jgi:hypothetical protein
LIGGLAGYLYYFRTKNPLKPLHTALPDSLQKALGLSAGGSYSTITHMPGVKPSANTATLYASSSAPTTTSSPAMSKVAAGKSMPAFIKGNTEATQARISLLSSKKVNLYGGV